MQVRLEVAQKNAKVKKVVLKADAIIGRSAQCQLRIASSDVSRQHCKLTLIDSGVLVRDLESSNGTFVDGKIVPPNHDVALTPGCELSIGPVKFIVQFETTNAGFQQPGSTVDLPAVSPAESTLAAPDVTARNERPPEYVAPSQAADVEEDDETATVLVERDTIAETVSRAMAEEFPEEATPAAISADEDEIPSAAAVDTDEEEFVENEWDQFSLKTDDDETIDDGMPEFPADDVEQDEETVEEERDEPSVSGPVADARGAEPAKGAGGLKSIFGLFGRKKSKPTPANAPAPAAIAPIAEPEELELPSADDVDEVEPDAAELIESAEEGGDVEQDNEDASLKDFFNQFGQE